jgi:hypothetical protein
MLNKNRVYLPNIQNSRSHLCGLGLLGPCSVLSLPLSIVYKGNNKITELRTILQRESQNS